MEIISTEEELRGLIPNVMIVGEGEIPLINKLASFIELAENWVKTTFVSEPLFDEVCEMPAYNPLRLATSRLVVAEALIRAIPMLDVVFAPNGIATVGTQNLVAASKTRVDRLIASVKSHRDDCIATLLIILPASGKWSESRQGQFFGSTLFPTLSITDSLGVTESKWEKYLELHSQIKESEDRLANEWFSPELMEALRKGNLRRELTEARKNVAEKIKTAIVSNLKTGLLDSNFLSDIVEIIRRNTSDFHEWHTSETSRLFSSQSFRNNKKSGGYFF